MEEARKVSGAVGTGPEPGAAPFPGRHAPLRDDAAPSPAGPAAPCPCPSAASISRRRNPLYDKYFSALMWVVQGRYDKLVVPLKRRLFGELMAGLAEEEHRRQQKQGHASTASSSPPATSQQHGGSTAPSAVRSEPQQPAATVLEVGIGGAPNFPYYIQAAEAEAAARAGALQQPQAGAEQKQGPPNEQREQRQQQQQQQQLLRHLRIVGVDPNPEMLKLAAASVANTQLPPGWAVELLQGSAEALPFGDGTFDAVVVTLVLCSVPSPSAALAEIRRVLRPGGRLLLLEHVRAPEERRVLCLMQRLLNPLWGLVGDGCSMTRDTLAAVREAGFDTSGMLSFDVPGLWLLSRHIAGVARVAG